MTSRVPLPMRQGERVKRIETPTGPMSILGSVAARLLQEGIISGELDGRLHANDATTVKVAMMTHGVCDFCSSPGVEHVFNVPDFDLPESGGAARSTDGWAACATCGEFVKANRRKDLFARALASLTFAKFTKPAIQELHNRFWAGFEAFDTAHRLAGGVADYVENMVRLHPFKPVSVRDQRLDTVSRISGLTVEELEVIVKAGSEHTTDLPTPLALKLLNWSKRFGTTNAARLLASMEHKPLPVVVPHWQQALDAQFEVATVLGKLLRPESMTAHFPDAIDLHDEAAILKKVQQSQARMEFRALGFDQDLRFVTTAQAYSFNAETEAAIFEAAQGIPHDAPLSSIETPNTGAGWFWFSEPLAVAASPAASDRTHALLWAWVDKVVDEEIPEHTSALVFSAYVRDEKDGAFDKPALLPSTRWYWPLHLSFHDMLALNTASWKATYGPGSPMEHDPNIIGQDATIKIIADLSLFFVMACVWFRQTVPGQPKKLNPVLTQTPGHIERHARKRYMREHKLSAVPVVHVVALRKTARTPAAEAPAERVEGARQYHCKWIVKGHPRLQACGPGRKDRKLIFIESYPKGPEDMPLRTKTTVFAVVR